VSRDPPGRPYIDSDWLFAANLAVQTPSRTDTGTSRLDACMGFLWAAPSAFYEQHPDLWVGIAEAAIAEGATVSRLAETTELDEGELRRRLTG
jgi:hypothetical protein